MKVVLTEGLAPGLSLGLQRLLFMLLPRGYENQDLGAKTASLECGVHRDSRSLRSGLESGLEDISAAVLLVP